MFDLTEMKSHLSEAIDLERSAVVLVTSAPSTCWDHYHVVFLHDNYSKTSLIWAAWDQGVPIT